MMAHFEVVQTVKVFLEITGLLQDHLRFFGIQGGLTFESGDQFANKALIELVTPPAIPGSRLARTKAIKDLSSTPDSSFRWQRDTSNDGDPGCSNPVCMIHQEQSLPLPSLSIQNIHPTKQG